MAMVVSCMADAPPEDTGEVGQAVADEPGNHGADQPWVVCSGRIEEDAVDPLGPVIAHGFKEASGYAPGLLDNAQKHVLRGGAGSADGGFRSAAPPGRVRAWTVGAAVARRASGYGRR